MPTNIDSLQIEINAQSSKANDAISKLADKLDRLSISLGRLNTGNLSALAQSVGRLGTSMQTMNGIKTADFTRLATNLERLNNIDTSKISSLSVNVNRMATAFGNLSSLSEGAKNIGELAGGIKQLGYSSSTKALENIPKLAVAMKDLMKTLSGAPKVSQNLIDMTNALARLSRTGSSSGRAANSLAKSLDTYTRSTSTATKGTKSLSAALGKMYATYWLLFRAFGKLGDAIDVSSSLTEVQNVVDVTFGEYSNLVEKMSDTSIVDFGMSELTAKQVSSRFQAMGTAMGFTQEKMADMSIELTKLTADMASFYNMSQEDVAKDLESIFTGMTRPLRTYGLDLTEATLKEWAMKQGLDADIDSMTQMEKTMLRYQYVMANTGAAQGDFARTSNTWANQTRILKQNLEALASVIGGTLINALKPLVQALNAAMSRIIAFAETISNALGKIFGWTFERTGGGIAQDFEDAAGSADDLASGIGDAEDNAKKLNKQLQGFDALNNLTSPNKDKSGGEDAGGFGGADANGLGGQWVETDSLLDKYKSDIDSLYELGEYIGKALTDAMNNIDWEKVYEKARNFGRGLADFLNGLISPDLFGALGRTIAGALNAALYFLNEFGKTFDWKDFGLSLATGINEFFKTFKFDLLADTINVWAHGILDTIIEFLDKTDWSLIGTKIGEFLAGIDFTGIGMKIAEAIWKAISAAFEVFASSFKVAPIETLVASLIVVPKLLKKIASTKFVKGIANLADKFLDFSKNAKLVATGLAGNKDSITMLSGKFPKLGKAVDVVRQAFANFRFGIENGNFLTGLGEAITTIRNNLTGLQKGVITGVAGFAEFEVISNTFEGLVDGSENVGSAIAKIGTAAGLAAAAMYTALGPAGIAVAAVTGLVAAFKGIDDAFDTARFEEIGVSIKNALTTPGGVGLGDIAGQYSDIIGGISDSFSIINEQSAGLSQADKNIENVWLEIEKIETAMDAGVMSVEDGVPRLNELFTELSDTATQKFGILEDTLLAAFGENGVLNDTFNRLGISTENTTATIIQLNDKVEDRIQELTQLISQTDPTSPQYAEYKEELAGLMTQTDELTTAMQDYQFALQNIDYSGLFNEDGEFDAQALQRFLDEIVSVTNTANTDIETAISGVRQSLQEELNAAISVGDTQSAEEIQEKLDALPEALELLQSDVKIKAAELAGSVQSDLIERTEKVLDDATAQWGEKSPLEKWTNGIFGAGTEGDFAYEAADTYKTNVLDPAMEQINSALSEMEIDSNWSEEQTKELFGGLFDVTHMGGELTARLNENYGSIIQSESLKTTSYDGGYELGTQLSNGTSDGINGNISSVEEASKGMSNSIIDIARSVLGVHSPSTVFAEIGKNLGLGLQNGITQGSTNIVTQMQNLATNLKNVFVNVPSAFMSVGKNIMNGMLSGINSVAGTIYNKAKEIANNVAQSVKNALNIHSPSRVMFELGDYTMQGFQLGLEKVYKPILSSVEKFGSDLQFAAYSPVNPIGSYELAYASDAPYQPTQIKNDGYAAMRSFDNAETNALLRELISAVRESGNIEWDGSVIGEKMRDYDSQYYNRTGHGAFQH